MKISPALMIAIVGAAAVFFFMQQTARASVVPPLPRLSPGGTWEYPPGTSAGPTESTYRDPAGAVLFKPDYTGPVDWT